MPVADEVERLSTFGGQTVGSLTMHQSVGYDDQLAIFEPPEGNSALSWVDARPLAQVENAHTVALVM